MSHPLRKISRRTLVKSIAYAGAAVPLLPARLVRAVSPNSKLRHVSIGASGMAWSDLSALARHPHFNLHAICDVDESRMDKAKEAFPQAKTYTDWRVLLDKEEKNFDSANVTVPDHMHAPIAMSMIHRGKHVYCQKPLTHHIYEARQLRLAADKAGVVTQMGIQIHSQLVYRLGVHLIQSAAIGKVKEVHAWSNKSWGGGERPDRSDPIPAGFDWDHWLGVAPARPFVKEAYHTFNWRRWIDFGTGTFGDMGCHIYDPVFEALGVGSPTGVRSVGPAPFKETWPTEAQVHYLFPGTPFTAPTVAVTWYDGGRMPPREILALLGGETAPGEGSIFIGTEGVMLMPHVASPRLFPVEKFKGVKYPQIPTTDHWSQFVSACLGEGKTLAPFSYSGPLTEAVLLGGIAVRYPNEELQWDGANLKFPNKPDANSHLRREYRKGWEDEGLS